MTKLYLFIVIAVLGFQAHGEPFQDCFRYGTYGLVAGALAGGTSMALAEDPSSNLTPVARGASIGLYAGLLVAVIKNVGGYKEPSFDVQPISVGSGEDQGLGLAFFKRF